MTTTYSPCASTSILQKILCDPMQTWHDKEHLLKVHNLARTIALQENMDDALLDQIEIAAALHDIACPALRKQYGKAPGHEQEKLGFQMIPDYLQEFSLPEEIVERTAFLVGHHHTWQDVDGLDWQILLEADYLVNAMESGWSKEQNEKVLRTLFVTQTGKELLEHMLLDLQ